ncbi:hypothetical protein NC653_025801 [Populus alba x Populus x berolinensis]|uniref:Uncharacterized protein n=1 Tax=Populus alba x Populus x berolinensis TaxID=444605 RepID=A0AAD6MD83_9ROSI|nr:hypothetical protein NC653_025793 [Populus alba x Populus x berolinensis]KAJ6982800.1 hypothetical protein NC653_025801 [Populus alba x Populus x berolinensis]
MSANASEQQKFTHPLPYKVRRAAEREEDGRSMREERTNQLIAKSSHQGCLLLSWCITATSINSYVDDRRVDLKTHSFF